MSAWLNLYGEIILGTYGVELCDHCPCSCCYGSPPWPATWILQISDGGNCPGLGGNSIALNLQSVGSVSTWTGSGDPGGLGFSCDYRLTGCYPEYRSPAGQFLLAMSTYNPEPLDPCKGQINDFNYGIVMEIITCPPAAHLSYTYHYGLTMACLPACTDSTPSTWIFDLYQP